MRILRPFYVIVINVDVVTINNKSNKTTRFEIARLEFSFQSQKKLFIQQLNDERNNGFGSFLEFNILFAKLSNKDGLFSFQFDPVRDSGNSSH